MDKAISKYKPAFGTPARKRAYQTRQHAQLFRSNGDAQQRAAALLALYGKADKR